MFTESSGGISLPFTDMVLRISPRWSELGEAGQVLTLALFGLVPLALVGWLYRYELRLVKRSVALVLLTLRVAVIALLWFVVCLQPILTKTTTREVATRVVVAFDISGSMNVTDPRRPLGDKLKLARALHLQVKAGEQPEPKRLDDWITQYDKKGKKATAADIQWVAADEQRKDADKRRALAGQRRAMHDALCAEVDRLSRLEITLRLLAADGGKLLKDIKAKHQVDVLGFDQKTVELSPEKLDKILQVVQAIKPGPKEKAWELKPEQSAKIFDLNMKRLDQLVKNIQARKANHKEAGWYLQAEQLDGLLREVGPKEKTKPPEKKEKQPDGAIVLAGETAATDLVSPLEQSLQPSGKEQGKLIGVVLLTDGRHNAPLSPTKSAEKLGKRKVPIYPVVLGTPFARPSVTLTEVQAPFNASAKNVDVTIRARFKVAGLKKQDIVVSLERLDKRPGQPKTPVPITIAHDGRDQYYDRSFVVSMDPDGKPLQTFVVAIKPAEKLPTGHRSQQVVIKMDDTKAKVLLVDGEARWEYHYLANALVRDPSLVLQRVVFEPPLLKTDISEIELRKMGNPQRTLPAGPDALADFQCIVLGDVAPEQLPLKERQRLEQFVAKHGGTLVVVVGKRFTPLAYSQLAPKPAVALEGDKKENKDETDPLLKLLPIEEARIVNPEQGFPVTLTREGKSTPFMQMEMDAVESEQRWADFPPHYWGIVGRAKPAATTLAYFRDPAKSVPDPMMDKEKDDEELKMSREQSLIVRQPYGRGQVLFVGLDSTWRWRYRIGDTYHHRFWGQVIRWASSDYIRFGTDKPVYQEGQDVTVDLSLEDKEARTMPAAGELKARILRQAEPGQKEKLVALLPLSAVEGLRVLKGQVRNLPAGRYKLELAGADKSLKAKLKDKPPATFLVTARDNKEMDHLETDEDLLRDLAKKSSDRADIFTPANASEVVERLTKRTVTRVERSERGLWQEWITLFFFLGLVTVEWVGRKWAGLP